MSPELRAPAPLRPEGRAARASRGADPPTPGQGADRPQTSRGVHESLAAITQVLGGDDVDVDELVSAGEGMRVEFKSSLRYDVKKGEKT